MVLTPIKRLFDKKDRTPWDNLVSDTIELDPAPNSRDALKFVTVHEGNYIKMEADISKIDISNLEVQWNYSSIYIQCDIKEGKHKVSVKSKLKMPQGAKKSAIEGHLLREDGRFFIKVPLKPAYRIKTEDSEWVSDN